MSGDDLTILGIFLSLATPFFFEGRKENGWRKYAFYGISIDLFLIGCFWPLIEKNWPEGAKAAHLIADNPESWFVTIVFLIVLFVQNSIQRRTIEKYSTTATQVGGNEIKENTTTNALEIKFEEEDPYLEIQQFDTGLIRRMVSFRIYNLGNGFLTETRVFIKNTTPPGPDNMIKAMAVSEPLPLGYFRTVQLANYVEVAPDLTKVADKINLGWIHGGGFLAGSPPSFDPRELDSPLVVTVEALARQCAPSRATFKIWIESGTRKLRAQRF